MRGKKKESPERKEGIKQDGRTGEYDREEKTYTRGVTCYSLVTWNAIQN